MAILGGIIYVDRPLTRSEKVGALIVYGGFAVVNFLVTVNLVELLNSAMQDIARFAMDACCRDSFMIKQVVARIQGPGHRINGMVVLLSHLVMAVLVILSVIFDEQAAAIARTARTAEEYS